MKKLILILMLCSTLAYAENDVTSSGSTTNTQSNTTGSNTAITGGYNSETTYATGSSNTSNTNNTTNAYQGDSRVTNTANAPALSNYSQDVCSIAVTAGVSTFSLGISGGSSKRDLNCERLKLAKALHDMGMKVGAVALLCQNPMVFEAMSHAGTSCPAYGLIGAQAEEYWKQYPELRPDYEEYTKNLRYTQAIDNKKIADMESNDEAEYMLDSDGNPTNISINRHK